MFKILTDDEKSYINTHCGIQEYKGNPFAVTFRYYEQLVHDAQYSKTTFEKP